MGKFANNPSEEESADNTSGDDNCHDVVLIAYLVHLPNTVIYRRNFI